MEETVRQMSLLPNPSRADLAKRNGTDQDLILKLNQSSSLMKRRLQPSSRRSKSDSGNREDFATKHWLNNAKRLKSSDDGTKRPRLLVIGKN